MEQPTNNSVTLSREGYILVKLVGKQDYMTMDAVAKECDHFSQQLKAENKPVLGMVDFTEDENFNAGTNRAVLQALENIYYDKAALFGTNAVLTEVTKAIVLALGKSENTKVFSTKEEALAWLANKDPLGKR